MKVASSRPPLTASTIVGKSVKRCDSNRVVVLVLDAKSVTGHVRCQVTGRKPTDNCCRAASLLPRCQGLKRSRPRAAIKITSPMIHLEAEDRNIYTPISSVLFGRERVSGIRFEAHLCQDTVDGGNHFRVREVSRTRQIDAQLAVNAGGPL